MMSEYQWLRVFAGNLRSLMDESHMNQRELAEAIGVSEGMVSRYLNMRAMPSVPVLVNIAHAFPCATIDDILYFQDAMETRPSRRW